jgi:hypothetical protein
VTAKPLSGKELAAFWVRYHEAADGGWSDAITDDLPPRDLHRLLVEIEWRRAEGRELREERLEAYVAGFCTGQASANDVPTVQIVSTPEVQEAFEAWHAWEYG